MFQCYQMPRASRPGLQLNFPEYVMFHFNAINSFCSKLENNLKHFQSGAPKKKKKGKFALCFYCFCNNYFMLIESI